MIDDGRNARKGNLGAAPVVPEKKARVPIIEPPMNEVVQAAAALGIHIPELYRGFLGASASDSLTGAPQDVPQQQVAPVPAANGFSTPANNEHAVEAERASTESPVVATEAPQRMVHDFDAQAGLSSVSPASSQNSPPASEASRLNKRGLDMDEVDDNRPMKRAKEGFATLRNIRSGTHRNETHQNPPSYPEQPMFHTQPGQYYTQSEQLYPQHGQFQVQPGSGQPYAEGSQPQPGQLVPPTYSFDFRLGRESSSPYQNLPHPFTQEQYERMGPTERGFWTDLNAMMGGSGSWQDQGLPAPPGENGGIQNTFVSSNLDPTLDGMFPTSSGSGSDSTPTTQS